MPMTNSAFNEADTCREFITPKLIEVGWNSDGHAIGEQRTFTNGRLSVVGGRVKRGERKRVDYLLF
jgi:type I restriction enzyme R subunit